MLDDTAPFILLDDARAAAAPGRLYERPLAIVEARRPDEVRPALAQLKDALARGLHAAGYIAYEAGHALEPRLARFCVEAGGDSPPLLWFGLFREFSTVTDVRALLPDPAGAWIAPPVPLTSRDDYEASVAVVKEHIAAGDIYQANLTFSAEVRTAGHPLAIYAAIRERAQAGHGGIIHTGNHWILSFSPELFFALSARTLTTRPMKGTAERRADATDDASAAAELQADPKQRAENLMIVDLLRNDLARVAKPGTVRVPALFTVETYPTIHQLVSTVTAEMEEGRDAVDVLDAIFPCGSITGAPKIRAMEIIDGLEPAPRNVYTGAIGRIAPGGDASFNVAIRTLTMQAGQQVARIGLGSGVVADSRPADEWRECLAKGAFLAGGRSFDLIETMRFDPHDGVVELERHLARMKASAEALGFSFDRHAARNELQAATFRLRTEKKLRLALSQSGAIAIQTGPMPPPPSGPVTAALARLPVAADDYRLRHKTSERHFLDGARRTAGTFEVVFHDSHGFITEGSFTNVFIRRGGRLLTPPLGRGLLPGILRQRLIEDGEAEEADLTADDLADGFFVGNSVRGLLDAVLHPAPQG